MDISVVAQTLILSGWTQPADALAQVADGAVAFDYSEYTTPAKLFTSLAAFRDMKHVVAWSLGGQLALRAIAVGALAPKHLTLIAAPHRFVGENGMGEETFRLFRESYARDPARTKTRFHGLVAKGDTRMREVMALLGHHPKVEDVAHWLPWLDALAGHTLVMSELASAPPTLIIHGMNDHIVPHAQGLHLAKHLPRAQLSSWADVGHAPHVHDAARLRAEIIAHRAKHGMA